MSELDKIKTAKAQLIESINYTGSLDDRLNDIEKAFEPLLVQPQLNKDQKIVLEWLKKNRLLGQHLLSNFYHLDNCYISDALDDDTNEAYADVEGNPVLLAQVMRAFTDWWLSENE